MSQTDIKSFLALDVGTKRIGVAIARADTRFASPLTTLQHSQDVFGQIAVLCDEHNVEVVVVGLPRGLDGQVTAQTQTTQAFARELGRQIGKHIIFQDEALTSVKAEAELAARKQQSHNKSDVDALAATYILEDYLNEHRVS